MKPHGFSERQALGFIGTSASSLRCQPAPDRNAALRERIVQLAHRRRRYGARVIYLKLRRPDSAWKCGQVRRRPDTEVGPAGL